MSNEKLKNQKDAVNKEWNKYCITKCKICNHEVISENKVKCKQCKEDVTAEIKLKCKICNHEITAEIKPVCKICNQEVSKREPKCKLCTNHGVTSYVKYHKYYCPFRTCLCPDCYVTKKDRERSAKDIKISRQRTLDRVKGKTKEKKNVNELDCPLPLEFNAKYTFLNYDATMYEKFKFMKLLTETLARLQYHPMASLLIPAVSDIFNIILRHARSTDDDMHIFRNSVEQTSIIRHLKIVCRAIARYLILLFIFIYLIYNLQIPFIHYLFPP